MESATDTPKRVSFFHALKKKQKRPDTSFPGDVWALKKRKSRLLVDFGHANADLSTPG